MTEKKGEVVFDNLFHKKYVGGEGDLAEQKEQSLILQSVIRARTYEEILTEYRWYVGDNTAQLPADILAELRALGRV